jgi:hypothetical protein
LGVLRTPRFTYPQDKCTSIILVKNNPTNELLIQNTSILLHIIVVYTDDSSSLSEETSIPLTYSAYSGRCNDRDLRDVAYTIVNLMNGNGYQKEQLSDLVEPTAQEPD